MHPPAKPWWQQVTALVSLSVGGGIAGFSFAPKAPAEVTSPTGLPIHLMALEQAAQPAPAGDAMLRAAIVHVASYYLRMAAGKTPAEMEAVIWQHDSTDGVDHGPSCAAFASLTLELGSQIAGQQSWVTGGSSYPWPLHPWADVRVDPNPAPDGVVSVLADAEAHGRWHPLGDGYQPLPGDWVLFDGHVEVVTKYAGGVLHTIGGDSVPNYSVNAHQYRGPLAAQGVAGFVNNGELTTLAPPGSAPSQSHHHHDSTHHHRARRERGTAVVPGLPGPAPATHGTHKDPAAAGPGRYTRHNALVIAAPAPDAQAQQAFIQEVAPGAAAAQREYGVPAAVTIAQAIDESGWGKSKLATRDHNLFGIKGTGPAGSDSQPSQEYIGGRMVTRTTSFRVYHNAAQSITDHGRLLAASGYYGRAMAVRHDPDAFAAALTGVYATDPAYGAKLVGLMRQYDLYRFDTAAKAPPRAPARVPRPRPAAPVRAPGAHRPRDPGGTAIPGVSEETVTPRAAAEVTPPTAAGAAAIPGLPAATTAASHPTAARWQVQRVRPVAARISASHYQPHLPPAVRDAITTMASARLTRAEPLYRDVASVAGIPWHLLAACDWMQCEARPRFSPVHGEKLGTPGPDGALYRTKSEALERCAQELTELAQAVYGVDPTAPGELSVRDLANVFAAFRWGGLLKLHHTSAMEFPYSVAGLTPAHTSMRWPNIDEPNTPDKPGSRFRMPFGAVPVVLSLHYPATV